MLGSGNKCVLFKDAGAEVILIRVLLLKYITKITLPFLSLCVNDCNSVQHGTVKPSVAQQRKKTPRSKSVS